MRDTADEAADRRFRAFLAETYPRALEANQRLKVKLLEGGVVPASFEEPLRRIRAEADLFRDENVPLLARERELENEYNKIIGAEAVVWRGEEIPLPRLIPVYQELDRSVREEAWRLAAGRQLQDCAALNELWVQLLDLRLELARNAGLPDYRSYRWQELLRFDYTPEDSARLHRAIEKVAVPVATQVHRRRQQRLGVSSLRPWDLLVDPLGRPPLRPYDGVEELERGCAAVFLAVDPELGNRFKAMIDESLLDLESRKNKGPGGFCIPYVTRRRPFIFMSATGLHYDVATLLHEGGHAFHVFETEQLPYIQQIDVGMEFAEVASMSMELLALPHLARQNGGFYTAEAANRATVEQLERILLLLPRLAATDMFQHWAYAHAGEARDPSACDSVWAELSARFSPGVDWSGLETERATGWQHIVHIFAVPFYMIEYALAQLGAIQVWANSLQNRSEAVARYRAALALGGTRSIPELYEAAGARLAFDEETVRSAVDLVESTLDRVDAA